MKHLLIDGDANYLLSIIDCCSRQTKEEEERDNYHDRGSQSYSAIRREYREKAAFTHTKYDAGCLVALLQSACETW